MTDHPPTIFRASDLPRPPKFPLDNKIEDDWTDNGICSSCDKPFSEHNDRQIVACALKELRGEKRTRNL